MTTIRRRKKKDRYVLYTWKKGPDGKITYFED